MKLITFIIVLVLTAFTACGGEEKKTEVSATAVARQEIRKIVQEELKKELMRLETSESIKRADQIGETQKLEIQRELEKQSGEWRKKQEEIDRKLQKLAEDEQRQRWQQEVDRMYGP